MCHFSTGGFEIGNRCNCGMTRGACLPLSSFGLVSNPSEANDSPQHTLLTYDRSLRVTHLGVQENDADAIDEADNTDKSLWYSDEYNSSTSLISHAQ